MEVTINIGGEEIDLNEDNCQVFRFRRNPELDHAYYNDEERMFYIFSSEALLSTMETRGGIVVTADYPSHSDLDAWVKFNVQNLDDELDDLDAS